MRNEVSVALVLAGLPAPGWGQVHQTTVPLSGVTETAFTYFQQVEGHRFDEFLQRLRPARLSPDAKERVLKQLPQVDVVCASAGQQAKLHTLAPILRYHERESAIDVKVLRVGGATAAFLAGAAILITEPALEVLSSQELQATIAHELGHEYFWGEFELARQQRHYAKLQEIELRCDAIAVITLNTLGLDPESVLTSARKLSRYNGPPESGAHANRYVSSKERERFIRSMIGMVREAARRPPGVRAP